MNLTDYTIDSVKEFVSGDNELTPYLSGPKILRLFGEVGIRDVYDGGMPQNESRNGYIFTKLKEINGTKEIVKFFEILFDPRHFAKDQSKNIELALEKFNILIQQDGYRLELIEDQYKIIGSDIPENIEIEIHFEDIQSKIIEQINNAKFSIWIAVAWFTDKEILRLLYRKKQEGLNIRIVVIDDEINSKHGINYEEYFEAKRVKPTGKYENIMHHKFCIIDFRTVIHGSYNWTVKAQWNKETISVDFGREIAEKFAGEFINLIK